MRDLAKPQDGAIQQHDPTPEQIIAQAVQSGVSAAELQALREFARDVRKDRAEQAFNRAFVEFQRECPRIAHNREASIVGRGGGRFSYTYPDLDYIRTKVDPILRKHNLALNFADMKVEGQGDGMILTETAVLSHVEGHQRSASFSCLVKSASPAMTPQQVFGNASTYAQRRALGKVLGIHTGEPDTDGAGEPSVTITEEQRRQLDELIDEVYDTPETRQRYEKWFKERFGVEALGQLAASDYETAIKQLESKRNKQ